MNAAMITAQRHATPLPGNLLPLLVLCCLATAAARATEISGTVSHFTSANGVQERCIAIDPIPGAHYRASDHQQEAAYCSLNFSTLALCPKLWSTSPATIVYSLHQGADIARFERDMCHSRRARQTARSEPAVFKMSVNGRDTSATYAPSSWVYYHLSRYLHTQLDVPVAVYREMDRHWHYQRVVAPALQATAGRRELAMLAAGWSVLDTLEAGPGANRVHHELLTTDGKRVYGTLNNSRGERYGAQVNGTREGGWGDGQSYDFQQTPPYRALRNPEHLDRAIDQALKHLRTEPRQADGPVPSRAQLAFWMRDILEITLLDYILGQQDRIGNIDYIEAWTWLDAGTVQTRPAHGSTTPPADIAGFQPLLLKHTVLNDNDAGVRVGYLNFTRRTHMLHDLRHYHAPLYKRLQAMAVAVQPGGVLRQWLKESAGLSAAEVDGIATRTAEAYTQLSGDCRAGRLQLDLQPERFLNGAEQVRPTHDTCALEAPP